MCFRVTLRQVDAEDIGAIVLARCSRYLDPLASISIDLWIIVIGRRDPATGADLLGYVRR